MAKLLTQNPKLAASGQIPRYRRSSWILQHVINPLTRFTVGSMGMDDRNGTRILEVKGRTSGRWRSTPVRLLEVGGQRYLVAPQGETDWVRNLRTQGAGRIQIGSHVEEFRAIELTNEAKLSALRAYFTRFWSLAAPMTTVTSPGAPDQEYAAAAPMHPVFRIE